MVAQTQQQSSAEASDETFQKRPSEISFKGRVLYLTEDEALMDADATREDQAGR